MLLDLRGRRAVVSGGGRGIGRAVSLLLGRLGADVAVGFRHEARSAEEVCEAIRTAGSRAVSLQEDLARPGAGERLIASAEAALGPLDVVVLCHGVWKRAPIHEMTSSDWDDTLRVNLGSVREACSEAARRMLPRRRGAIVLIASTAGQRGEPFHAHYAASKGAVIALTKSLAAELGGRGIRVNCVAPGWVLTDMTRAALDAEGGETVRRQIPLGRPGTPEEIAGPVAFLVSDLSSYLHGQVLAVNGGAVMVG